MSDHRSVLLVGGPDAGKTNYLTRLWIALQAGGGCLRARGLPADAEYLNGNATILLGGHFAPHTSQNVHARNLVPVEWSDGGTGELVVPDCPGEEWEKIHRTRSWSEEWEATLPTLVGCLLFVRAGSDRVVAPLDWVNCASMFGGPIELPGAALATPPAEMPTQVLLIDWLQCLGTAVASLQAPARRLRVAVVISAWDRVPTDQQGENPSQYIASNFRMLSDFILSNSGAFEFAQFGVSVTGGDLDAAPGFREEYLSGDPATAGYVVHTLNGTVERSTDHSLPVAWAMGLRPGTAGAQDGGGRG
ncbi:MAG: hypothetical protein U0797_08010 [Gemmataceae bacterium]